MHKSWAAGHEPAITGDAADVSVNQENMRGASWHRANRVLSGEALRAGCRTLACSIHTLFLRGSHAGVWRQDGTTRWLIRSGYVRREINPAGASLALRALRRP